MLKFASSGTNVAAIHPEHLTGRLGMGAGDVKIELANRETTSERVGFICAQCVRANPTTQRTTAASSCTKVRRRRVRCAKGLYAHARAQAGAKLESRQGWNSRWRLAVTPETDGTSDHLGLL